MSYRLIFQSRRFRQACQAYCLAQECITSYPPQQNGLIERFFWSVKEECVRQHRFESFDEARQIINRWMRWFNEESPNQALKATATSTGTTLTGGLFSGEHHKKYIINLG